jgi:hypothetical protein
MKTLDKYSKWKWLSEPTTIDNSYSKVGESVVSWLGRSTIKRAQIFRQFLRENLEQIPLEYQDHFKKELQNRWDSAFLEFIVARTIQVLGGKFFIELKNSGGTCPDFLVSFGDHQLIIEVVSPKFDSEGDEERTRDKPLIKFINANMPTSWLAIHGSGYGVEFNDFDRALFGYKTIVENTRNNLQEAVIKPDGIFLESGKEDKSPTFAGILAFKRVDLTRHPDPVIYHHPRFFEELPEELMIFEQRRFRDSAINIQPPKRKNVLAELGFIKSD